MLLSPAKWRRHGIGLCSTSTRISRFTSPLHPFEYFNILLIETVAATCSQNSFSTSPVFLRSKTRHPTSGSQSSCEPSFRPPPTSEPEKSNGSCDQRREKNSHF